MTEIRDRMVDLVQELQDEITSAIAGVDGTEFREDSWERPGGGGGRSRVLEDGNVFEKAGVNVSVVHGTLSREAASQMGGGRDVEDLSFFATGVSLVLHPHNPMAPTVHANYRYFERGDGSVEGSWWFGGGADLTPSYLFEEDAAHFHRVHRQACDKHDPALYPRFKAACDEYFYIPHRQEGRGIGGIFFDDFRERGPEGGLALVSDCGHAFVDAYVPIVQRRKDMEFDQDHKDWQQVRRGRYVEFNLVHDRGTKFGLRTGGRIQSILMSLPRTARWDYDDTPSAGSREAEMLAVLREPRDWLSA